MERHSVTAADGTVVPLDWFPAPEPRTAFLLMPALGIQARLYTALAGQLAAGGCSVAVLEQRGHGRSELRASRQCQWGLAEFLDHDVPAAVGWLQRQAPGLPLLLGGHSLGGHLGTLMAGRHPELPAGVVHVATPMPCARNFPPRQAWLIRMLCVLISVFRVFPGYFPGERVGFGGRDPLELMRDWRTWATTGRYDFADHEGAHDAIARYRGPVLSVALDEDEYSSPEAVDHALSAFGPASITKVTLGENEQGEYLGHFRWARQPDGVTRAILRWIDAEVTSSAGRREQS